MKKICTSILALLATTLMMAQAGLVLLPDSIRADFERSLSDEYEEFNVLTLLANASSQELKLRWEVSLPEGNCPEAWRFRISDDNNGFPYGVTSNINIGSAPNVPLDISPQDTGFVILFIRPTHVEGCCTVKIRYSAIEGSNQETILDSSYIHVCISDSTVSSTFSELLTHLTAFPNPTDGLFQVTGAIDAKSIHVFNSIGQQVLMSSYQAGQTIDLSGLQKGLYNVCLKGEKGNLLYTTKLLLQTEGP